jgi:uncharacterized protein (DUF885 family)
MPMMSETTRLYKLEQSRSSSNMLTIGTFTLLAVLAMCSCNGEPSRTSDTREASAQLAALAEDVWNRAIARDPILRVREGLRVTDIPRLDYARSEEDAAYAQSVIDSLSDIDLSALPHDEFLTAETLRWESAMKIEGLQYYWLNSFMTPYVNPLPRMSLIFEAQSIEDLQGLDDYLMLVEQVVEFVRSMHETAYEQAARGYVVSLTNLPAVVGLTRSMIQEPEGHWLAPPNEELGSFATEDVEAFALQFGDLVSLINSTLESFIEYLDGEYRNQAPEGVGVKQYPNGDAYYRYLTRLRTTMDVTPEEVQQIGFEMVQDMQAEMATIQAEIGFEGTAGEFNEHLRSESRFFPTGPEEVAERLQMAADAFFDKADEYFIEVPRAPFGVRRLDPALEGSQTYGYYSIPTADENMGYYNYNGSNLNERSWLNLQGVAFHELFPGHHFHIARQFENDSLPQIRRNNLHTAFTEGWGSYSSYLGLEAGMYEDPYSRYGMYILEIFLATRLVVDPGMNYFDWTLQQARDFMRESTLESETQIATESVRYSTDMPGQALGYQMGKRMLLELRERAERELGENFDIRRFHEAVIGPGSMPMGVLEQHIDWFIDEERR